MLARWGLWTSPRCHACPADETVEHVTRCPSRREIWDKWWTRLEDALSRQRLRPGLDDALLITITALYRKEAPDLGEIDPLFHPAVRDQLSLGWRQTLTGKLSVQWTTLQRQFLEDQAITDCSPTACATTVIKCLVGFYQACWSHRTKHLPDDGVLAERRGAHEVDRMICEQYSEGREALPREMAHHFRLPRRFLLSRDIAWKRTWLDSILAARARAARRNNADDSQLRSQRALLHNWLARARTSTREENLRRRRPGPHPNSPNTLTHLTPASPGRQENGRRRFSTHRRVRGPTMTRHHPIPQTRIPHLNQNEEIPSVSSSPTGVCERPGSF